MLVSPQGQDAFRLPKELAFRAEVILLLSVVAILASAKRIEWPESWKRAEFVIPAIIIGWALLSTFAATNRIVSLSSFLWILGWAIVFAVTTTLARTRRIGAISLALIPAAINGALVLLQEGGIWNPFFQGSSLEHFYHTGLVGNPNDVGTFLVAPAVACFALIFTVPSKRIVPIAGAVLLAAALIANHTLTALAAYGIGVLAVTFMISKRHAAGTAIIACILVAGLIRFYPPLWSRYEFTKRFLALGYYDSVLSGRMLPFISAFRMFKDHPLLGVGPGCFKWDYFPYRLGIGEQYKKVAFSGETINYGQVHNDHLQILAETGSVGYILFATALIAMTTASFRRQPPSAATTPERRFARIASLPLVLAFAVLATGQFPLELAASTSCNIYLFALCRAWTPGSGPSDPQGRD